MRGVGAGTGGGGAIGVAGGWVGVARVVRLLTAVGLLGLALLVVALIDQGVAAARPLPTPPSPLAGDGDLAATRPPEGGLAQAGRPAVPVLAETGAQADLARSQLASAGVLARSALLSPEPQGTSPQGSRTPGTPAPWSAQLADNATWGYGKRPDELRVAGLPTVGDVGGNGTGADGVSRTGTAVQHQAELVVVPAESVKPATPVARSTVRQVMETASSHAGRVVDSLRLLKPPAGVPTADAFKQRIEGHRQSANETLAHASAPDALVPDAPEQARTAVWNAGVDLLRLGLLARSEGSSRVQAGGHIVQSGEAVTRWADELDASAAVARDAAPDRYPFRDVVGSVVQSARGWAQDLKRGTDFQSRLGSHQTDRLKVDLLIDDIASSAMSAESRAAFNLREEALAAMDATLKAFRQLGEITTRVGGELNQEGKGVLAVGEPAHRYANEMLRTLRPLGTRPGPAAPDDQKPEKDTQVVPAQPSPDAPVLDAGIDPEHRTSVATVQGDSRPVAQPTSAANGTPVAVAASPAPVSQSFASATTIDPDSIDSEHDASSPFDNEVLLTDLVTDTTVATTN